MREDHNGNDVFMQTAGNSKHENLHGIHQSFVTADNAADDLSVGLTLEGVAIMNAKTRRRPCGDAETQLGEQEEDIGHFNWWDATETNMWAGHDAQHAALHRLTAQPPHKLKPMRELSAEASDLIVKRGVHAFSRS